MLFDLIDRVLFSKRTIDMNIGDEPVHPYIMNRWISMYSTQMATLINNTGNWMYSVFEHDNQLYYKFLQRFLPRVARRRIHYIKKIKTSPTPESDDLEKQTQTMARNLELSTREIKLLLEYERQHRPTNTHQKSD